MTEREAEAGVGALLRALGPEWKLVRTGWSLDFSSGGVFQVLGISRHGETYCFGASMLDLLSRFADRASAPAAGRSWLAEEMFGVPDFLRAPSPEEVALRAELASPGEGAAPEKV